MGVDDLQKGCTLGRDCIRQLPKIHAEKAVKITAVFIPRMILAQIQEAIDFGLKK